MGETRIVRKSATAEDAKEPVRRFPPELTVAELTARNRAFTREQRMALVNGQLIQSFGGSPEARARNRILSEVVRPAPELATGAQGTTLNDLLEGAQQSTRPRGISIADQLAGLTVHDVVIWARALGKVHGTGRRHPTVFGEAPVTEGVESRSPLAEGSF